MSHVNDFICDHCGTWCSSAEIDGQSVPLVLYVVAGIPPDYAGPKVDLNAPGLKVPELVRELMRQPVARREYCVRCFAQQFGLPLVASPPS
jgi:hypothetical protein